MMSCTNKTPFYDVNSKHQKDLEKLLVFNRLYLRTRLSRVQDTQSSQLGDAYTITFTFLRIYFVLGIYLTWRQALQRRVQLVQQYKMFTQICHWIFNMQMFTREKVGTYCVRRIHTIYSMMNNLSFPLKRDCLLHVSFYNDG